MPSRTSLLARRVSLLRVWTRVAPALASAPPGTAPGTTLGAAPDTAWRADPPAGDRAVDALPAATADARIPGQRRGAAADPADLDAAVLASWTRSAALCVRPDIPAAPTDGADAALSAWRGSAMDRAVAAVAADVRAVVDDGGLVAAVTDRTGRITWTCGGRVMRRAAERVNFVPGGRWDEASIGTNALALALRTGQPSTVYSAEHFSAAVHGWVCYGVPLHHPRTGGLLGVLDLSTTWDRAHPLALGAAQALGHLLVMQLPADRGDAATPGLPGAVDLTVLGSAHLRVDGRPVLVPRRQLEIAALLALHPDGLSADALHADLYGDAPVSASTLKAEVSHLRAALGGGIGSRPYRFTVPVDSDAARVRAALAAGDLASAAGSYRGPLLAESQSPVLAEWRAYLEVALRTAALASADGEAVGRVAAQLPYDEALQVHWADCVDDGSPRRALAAAAVQRARGA